MLLLHFPGKCEESEKVRAERRFRDCREISVRRALFGSVASVTTPMFMSGKMIQTFIVTLPYVKTTVGQYTSALTYEVV